MKDLDRQRRLEQNVGDINSGLKALYEGPQFLLEGKLILDGQIRELRGQIADEMWEKMLRSGLNPVDGLIPVTDKSAMARLMSEGLLGHMKDETPTSRIIIIGSQRIGEVKPKDDPLYGHVFPKFTPGGIIYTIGALTALGRLIRPGFLDTLGSVREFGLAHWELLDGFGKSRAKFIHEAVRKIEIPEQ